MENDYIYKECSYSVGALDELVILSVTHKTLDSMEGLSAISFPEENRQELLQELKDVLDAEELVYISTCNRVSFLLLSARKSQVLLRVLSSWLIAKSSVKEVPDESQWLVLRGKKALDHVLLVASSLDSMVVGEGQIIGQLKRAFIESEEFGISGPKFHFLHEQIFKVAKRVYSNTTISHGRLSVVSLAEDRVSEFCSDGRNLTAVLVGAGKMIERMAEYLNSIHNVELIFVNRTRQRSDALGEKYYGSSISLNDFVNDRPEFDIIVTSTAAPHHLFGKAFFESVGAEKKILAIDLAVPNDIDPAVEEMSFVNLINMESLRKKSQQHADKRREAVTKAQEIIEEGACKIIDRWKIRTINPAIGVLKKRYEQESMDQLNKLLEHKLSHLDDAEKDELSAWALKMAKHWAVIHASGVKRTARDCCMKAVMTYLDGTGIKGHN